MMTCVPLACSLPFPRIAKLSLPRQKIAHKNTASVASLDRYRRCRSLIGISSSALARSSSSIGEAVCFSCFFLLCHITWFRLTLFALLFLKFWYIGRRTVYLGRTDDDNPRVSCVSRGCPVAELGADNVASFSCIQGFLFSATCVAHNVPGGIPSRARWRLSGFTTRASTW